MERIAKEDVRIVKINETHRSVLKGFSSYERELVEYLHDDVLDNQARKVSITYLWFYVPSQELIAYVNVLADAINLEGNLKARMRDAGIVYKSLPALKIGRLCVSDTYLHRGIGTLMIQFVINLAHEVGKEIGVRFITTDAKRNTDPHKDVTNFYKKIGFEILKQNEKGATPLYLDLFGDSEFEL